LQLNLAGVGNLHFIQIGPQQVDLTTLATTPTIVPDPAGANALFAIGTRQIQDRELQYFRGLREATGRGLTPTATLAALAATGQYDSKANTFTASRIAVLINDRIRWYVLPQCLSQACRPVPVGRHERE
jgi:hypothetical protein